MFSAGHFQKRAKFQREKFDFVNPLMPGGNKKVTHT